MKSSHSRFASSLRRITCACLLLGTLFPIAARAEDRNDGALWTLSQIAIPLSERFSAHMMVQNRWVANVESYQRTVYRPWVGFDWTDRINLAVGYDRHDFENPVHRYENRAWQRIAYTHPFGDAKLLTHLWMEERFFEGSNSVAVRARILLGVAHPLPLDFGMVVRNEWLVDVHGTSIIRRGGLGEDQFFAGFNHPIGRWATAEVGYLMNYLDRRGPDQFNHALFINVSIKTPAIADWF